MVEKRFDHAKFGLKPNHGVLAAHWTVNDELPNRLACGTVVVKPNIQSFTPNGIVFVDGSEVKHVDQVVMSTDFRPHTIAVIGLIQPLGSIMPISEMQARVYFDAFTGGSRLPFRTEMEKCIIDKKERMEERYVRSRRHTIQVDYVDYMDDLAELIGCKPQPWRYLFSDPPLAYHLMFGPDAPYAYRLRGPKPWSGARQALLSLDKRVRQGMCGNDRQNRDYLLSAKQKPSAKDTSSSKLTSKSPSFNGIGSMNFITLSTLFVSLVLCVWTFVCIL
uniref:Flavin-containing monooxygenase n=1 Tax=Ditylenchus dipsaci TaxID=166011 RepID=A0A915DHG7_9BILA